MQYDVVILGGGAAGFGAALKLEGKARVLMVNDDAVGIGGTCINVGCVPSKHIIAMAEHYHKARNSPYRGVESSASFDWKEVVEEKRELVESLRRSKYEEVLSSMSVDFVEGKGKVVSGDAVEVNGETYGFKNILIATGSSPLIPSIKGLEDCGYLTNKEALELEELPESIAILGGGAVGVEFAQMFARFGVKVYVILRGERILKREEPNLARMLMEFLEGEGIEFIRNATVSEVRRKGEKGKVITYAQGGETKELVVDEILVATGRKPNTQGIGLENLGVELNKRGSIITDDYLRAGKNAWAAGDVTEGPMLETKAGREGAIAGMNMLGEKVKKPKLWPHTVFSSPELASVGLTDEEARDKGCTCRTVSLEQLPKAHILHARGAAKIVAKADSHEVLGVHVLSPRASDIIMEGTMIVKNNMKLEEVIETLHVFPSLGEIIKLCAQSFFTDVSKLTCCAE